MNLKNIIIAKVKKKLASDLSEKELKWHDELVEEIKDDKNFTELSDHVALRQHSHLKQVHGKLLDYVNKNKIKGMTTYAEAFDKFYQSGVGPGADLVHVLMKKEGITI